MNKWKKLNRIRVARSVLKATDRQVRIEELMDCFLQRVAWWLCQHLEGAALEANIEVGGEAKSETPYVYFTKNFGSVRSSCAILGVHANL